MPDVCMCGRSPCEGVTRTALRLAGCDSNSPGQGVTRIFLASTRSAWEMSCRASRGAEYKTAGSERRMASRWRRREPAVTASRRKRWRPPPRPANRPALLPRPLAVAASPRGQPMSAGHRPPLPPLARRPWRERARNGVSRSPGPRGERSGMIADASIGGGSEPLH